MCSLTLNGRANIPK